MTWEDLQKFHQNVQKNSKGNFASRLDNLVKIDRQNAQTQPGSAGNPSPSASAGRVGTAPAGTRIQSDYEAAQRANARRNYEYRQTTGQLPSQSGEDQELSHRRDVVRDRQVNYLQNGGTVGSSQNQVFQRSIDAIDAEIAGRQNDRQKEAQTRAKNTADALKYNQKTFEKRAKEAKKQYGEDSDEYRAAQQRADEATKAVWEAGLPWQMRVANYADAVGGRLVGTAPQLAATLTRPPENEIRDNEFSRRYVAMNNWLQSAADYAYDVSAQGNAALKYGLGKVGSTVADVAVTGGEMLSDAAMNMILPGSGMAAMGMRAGASGANEAYHAGATPGQEFMYGAATAGVEMLTEKMFDGMAKVYGAGAADEITEGIVRRLAETNGGRTLARMLINAPGEGIEEVVSDLANPFIKYIYDNGAALQKSYGTGEGFKSMMQEAGYDFLVGAILGVGGAAASVTNGEAAARNARLALQDDFITQMSTGDGSSFFIEPHSGQTTRFGVEQYGDTWWGYAIDGQGKTYWQNGYKSRSAAERGTAVAASDWIVEQAANPENRANDADVRARDEQRAETAAENPGSTIADDQAVEIQKTLQDSGAKNSSLAQAVKLSGIVDKIINGDTSLSNNAIRDLDLYHNKGLLSIVEQKTGEKIDTSSNKRIVADVRAIVERRAELYAIEDEQKTAQAAAATQSIPQTASETENPAQEDVFAEGVQALPGEAENAVEASTAAETSEDAGSTEPTITLRNGRTVNRQQFIEDIVQARNSAERTVASDAFDKLYAESGAAETQQQATAQQTAAPAQTQQQAEGGTTARRTAQKPGLIRDEYTKSQEQRQMNIIDLVAKRLGVTVRFVDRVNGGAANAQYADGVVEIEKYNRNPVLFLFGHEITHHLQTIAPESYQAFRDAAMMDIPNAEDIIQKKIQLYADRDVGLDRQSAMDELAADYAGQMVDSTSVLERFIERHKENRSLLQRLADAFRSLIDRVGGRYRVNAKNAVNLLEKALRDGAAAQEKAERQEAREQKREQKQASRAQAKENTATKGGEGEARFSIKTDNDGRKYVVVDRQQGRFIGLNKAEAAKLAKEIILEEFSGQTLPLGEYAATTIYRQSDSLRRARGDRYDGASKYVYDGEPYTDSVFLAKMRAATNLDEMLEAAEYVDHERDGKNHTFARDGFDYYKVTFVVDNRVFEGVFNIGLSDMGATFYGMTKIKQVTDSSTLDLTPVAKSQLHGGDLHTRSIRGSGENVNSKFSLKEDSDGRSLTKAQQAYFKDSKVRDEDGRLIPVYHATYADDFTVFDRGRLGENTDGNAMDENWAATSHIGFWFNTENLSIKSGFGSRAESVYLNITDPFSAYSIEALAARMGQYEGTPADRGEAFADWLRGEGYDGIVVQDEEFGGTSYVALDPEQIKRVTNKNPTDNPDIRYHIGGVDTEAPDAIESSVQRALALRDSDATPSEIFNQTGLVSLPDGRLRDGMSGNIVWEADDERGRKEGQDGSGGAVQRGKTSGGASETRSVGAAKQSQTRAQTRDRGVDQRQNRQDRSAGKAGTRNWKQLKNAEKAAFRSAVEEYLEETGADVADTLDLVWGNGSGDVDLAIDAFAQDLYSRIGESDLVLENELIAPLGRGDATSLIRKFRSIADEQKSGNVQYSMPAEKRTPSKPRTAYSFAKEVTADYASDFDKHTVAKSVRDIGVLLKDGDERTAAERAHSMAQAVVSTAAVVVNDEEVATRRSIRDYLKGTKLRISDELARGVDGIEALRNGPLAFMTSRTSGLPVDVAYMEMQASFGTHLFPEDVVNPADQLQRIADVLDQLQPKYENPFGRTQREQEQAVMELAERILDTAEQLPRADLRKADTFVSMTETREFQEFKRQYDATYGEGATDAAIRSVKAYERAMQREAARRKAMRERPDAAETRAENARILAKTRSEHVEARKKASLSRLFESKEKTRLRQENRELISWGANYVQQAEAAAERAEQRRVRQLSQQAEHAELMKRRAVLRVKFRDSKTLMSAKIRDGQKLANQKRKTQQAVEDARQARKEARILARRSAQDSMSVINSSRRNTEQALEPAPIDTLRSIVPEQKKTWAERKHDLIEGAKDTGRKLRTALFSDTLALEKLSSLQVDAGAEGLTSYEGAKIAKACNSTIEMTYHDGLYDTEGNRIAEPLKEVAVVWKTENGKKVVDYEGQAVFQDYRLHLHNIDRMSLRERALQKVADFEAANPWLREAPTRELALIAEGAYTDHGKRKDPRQQIVKDYVQLLKKAREAVNKPVFADTAGNPVTADASQRIVEKYEREYPDIVEQSRRLDEWWDTFMRTYVVGVTMSLEDYEAMREIYPHYTPTYRVNQGQRGRGVYAGGGTVSTGSFVKAATGSLKEVRYIEDSYADLVARAIRQNRFNALCANIVETAMNDDSGTFAGFMLFDWETQKNTVDKLGWLTDRDGLDGSEKHEPPALEKDGGACRVSCWINGERVSAYISEDLYNSLAAVAGNKSNSRVEKAVDVFTGIGNKVTSPMKTFITGINPLFGIRNFIRDVPTAVVNSHAGARMLKYIPKAISMSKNNSTEWQAYCALGGTSQSYYRNENGRQQGNAIANWDTRSEMTPWGKVKRGAKKAADTIGWFNELTENAVRFAEYLCAIDNLPGGDTYENRVRGIYYAGEVSVDFSRRGTLGRTVNAWIPYWNPAMQGISKVFRSCLRDVTRKHKGFQQLSVTVARAVLTAAMPEALAMVCRMIAGREDEWEQLSDYVKDNFYCFPIPGKNNQYKFLKVPKNREWAALISNPLWRIVAGIKGREDPFANYWDDSIKANFIPPFAWEAIGIDQYLSIKHNEDFAGRPIVGNQFKDYTSGEYASKKLQYDGDTWAIAKLVSDAMANKLSPVQWEYIIHSYCGDLGDLLFGLVDMDTWNAITGNTPEDYDGWHDLYELVTAGPKKFVADARYSNAATSKYYETMDELGSKVADAKILDPAGYKDSTDYQVRSAIQGSYTKQIQDLNKQIREMADGPEKDALKLEVAATAQEALDFYNAAQNGEITQPKQYMAYEKTGVNATVRDALLALDGLSEDYKFDPSEFSAKKTISAHAGKEWQLDEIQKQQWRDFFADEYNERAEALIGSARYINATDARKAAMLEGVYEEATKAAKDAVVKWMKEQGYSPVKKEK